MNNENNFTFVRTEKSKYKVSDTKKPTIFFERKKDAIAYLREKKTDWQNDFHNGLWGDCSKPFFQNCTYVPNWYISREGRTVKIHDLSLKFREGIAKILVFVFLLSLIFNFFRYFFSLFQ